MTTPSEKKHLLEKLLTWADKTEVNRSLLPSLFHKLVRLFLITITEFKRNDLSLRSGALTYTIMLSLVPMLAMSTAVVKGLGGGDELRKAAYTYIDSLEQSDSKPTTLTDDSKEQEDVDDRESSNPGSLTKHLRSAVDQLFDYVDNTNFATLGTIGMVGILLSALLVLSHIEIAMNEIWKVSAGRSTLRKIADYLTLLILMPVSINVAFAATAFLENPALASKMDAVIPFEWVQSQLLKTLPVFFIALSFYVLYIFFTNTRVRTLPALTGAISAAILWFAMQNIFVSFQVGVARQNAIYGSFATVPLFLVWMYLGWIFILTGAQLAFACQYLNTHTLLPANSTQPSYRLGAAFDIMEKVYSSFAQQNHLSRSDLIESQALYYPRYLVEEVLEELIKAEFLYISQADARVMPTSPVELFSEKEIVDVILGNQSPSTPGGQKSLEIIEAAKPMVDIIKSS